MARVPAAAFAPLERMIQASLLLQIPKQMNNVSMIVDELTVDLTGKQVRASRCPTAIHAVQVLSILTHYKPASSQYSEEGPVSASFLDAIARRLNEREVNTSAAAGATVSAAGCSGRNLSLLYRMTPCPRTHRRRHRRPRRRIS